MCYSCVPKSVWGSAGLSHFHYLGLRAYLSEWAWCCRQPSKQGSVCSPHTSCLNFLLLIFSHVVFFFLGIQCKCKRISFDESRPINSYNLAEFLLPVIPANHLKWNTTTTLQTLLQPQIKVNPSSKSGHTWGCVRNPEKEW